MARRSGAQESSTGGFGKGVLGWLGLAALIVAGIAIFAAFRGGGGDDPGVAVTERSPIELTPVPDTATEATAATSPSTEPASPAGTAGEDFDEMAEQVSQVRGLPVEEPIDAEVVSDAALGEVLNELIDEEIDLDEVEADRRLLAALRLIPEDLDLVDLLYSLYDEQVIGLYVPEDETLYVQAAEDALTPLEEVTAAHEIQHALQDQAFDLEQYQDIPDVESDAALAQQSLVEGDAVITQQLWSLEYQDEQERSDILSEAMQQAPGEAMGNAPAYLREGFVFPYQQGTLFVQALLQSGGLEAVDAAFRDPPTTTEQILHPEVYLAGEGAQPAAIEVDPGQGWTDDVSYTFGEFDVDHLLRPLGAEIGADAAEGWGGGMVRSWVRDDDVAVAGRLIFDSPEDATEACDAFGRWYEAVDGGGAGDPSEGVQGATDAYARTCTDTEVRFGVAPDVATAVTLAG